MRFRLGWELAPRNRAFLVQDGAVQNARTNLAKRDRIVPLISRKQLGSVLLALAMMACSGDPSSPSLGSLRVSVLGLPGGSAANVTVTGPGGFSQLVTATQTLTNLAAGTYAVAAATVSAGPSQYSPNPPNQTVAVNGAQASASVLYSTENGNLTVTINGMGTTGDAAVTVTGPGGYNQPLGSTTTLTNLTPGSYTVTASDAVAPGGTTHTPSPPSQTVVVASQATATATVTYSPPPDDGTVNLRIAGMYITQSAQSFGGAIPLVKDRNGYLRVFVVANRTNASVPTVRVRFYSGLLPVDSVTILPPPLATSTPTAVDESSLSYSWNVPISGGLIQPGFGIQAVVDPAGAVAETDETDNAFPAAAPLALTVRTVPTLNVTLVPVVQRGNGLAGNVSNPSGFMETIQRMHPVATINTVVHAPYTTTTSAVLQANNGNNAWSTILGEIDMLRIAETSSRYYYGVAKVAYTSGVAGVAYVSDIGSPQRAALGWDYLPSGAVVAAHELAHNWARNHAPCGNPAGLDNAYPHPDGSIGVYGLDVVAQTLKPPTTTDIMGYCDPKWIGDYNYQAAMDYLGPPSPVVMNAAVSQAVQPTLLVWGHIRDGEMVLEPAFQVNTRPRLPERPGPYSVEARSSDGATLFHLSFAAAEIADAPGGQANFVFAVPLASANVARISTLRLSGHGRQAVTSAPAGDSSANARLGVGARLDSVEVRRVAHGRVGLRWNASVHPMVMVRDARSGEVLSLARGGDVELSTVKGDVELVLSDGVRSRVKRISVKQ